jgi:hypothetical protein
VGDDRWDWVVRERGMRAAYRFGCGKKWAMGWLGSWAKTLPRALY